MIFVQISLYNKIFFNKNRGMNLYRKSSYRSIIMYL